jgi:hypothetical protein
MDRFTSFGFCVATLLIISLLGLWIREDLNRGEVLFDTEGGERDDIARLAPQKPNPLQLKIIVIIVAVAYLSSEVKHLLLSMM